MPNNLTCCSKVNNSFSFGFRIPHRPPPLNPFGVSYKPMYSNCWVCGLNVQRQSDGTIALEGVRFEVPARFRHFREVVVRYARWDLSRVDLVDPRHGTLLAPLYPLDRAANADGRRAIVA